MMDDPPPSVSPFDVFSACEVLLLAGYHAEAMAVLSRLCGANGAKMVRRLTLKQPPRSAL